jgi:LacI family transcriptional regulator
MADRARSLICTNDDIATGAMIEAKPLNPMIPDDLSIGGFHDTDMSTYLDPPLMTTKCQVVGWGKRLPCTLSTIWIMAPWNVHRYWTRC